MTLSAPSTLKELLSDRAEDARHGGYSFAREGAPVESMSFPELYASARRVAALLTAAGAVRGSRVLLLCPPGLEFIAAFFGCFQAGATAVPVLPPNPARLARTVSRLRVVAADCDAKLVLTTSKLRSVSEEIRSLAPELARCTWIASDSDTPRGEPPEVDVAPSDVALLQYTSGSTRTPRGVVLTHANLMHNQGLIRRAFRHRERDLRVVSWLPVYHDMGLIGMVMQPLFMGGNCLLMAPLDFLRKPFLWLSAISKTRAQMSGAPNFAFELAARTVTEDQRAQLDLSSLEVMYCGAEPIRKATLDRFADRFAPQGFRQEAYLPCYGLAEASLLVSGQSRDGGAVAFDADASALRDGKLELARSGGRTLVGCGPPVSGQEVIIVHDGQRAQPGTVGEIWIRGGSVGAGYFNKPEETAQTFGGRLRDGTGPFLRTGDLGAFDDGGELYVLARLKDLLIVRGLNHHPQDVEASVESSWVSFRPNSTVAFTVDGVSGEDVVVVCEYDARAARAGVSWEPVVDAIRSAVAAEHEIAVHTIAIVAAGEVPKTSSGKVQRAETRRRLLAGELELLHRWDAEHVTPAIAEVELPRTAVELSAFLASLLSELLGRAISRDASFAAIGLDSLDAVQLTEALSARIGREVSPIAVIDYPSIPALAEYLVSLQPQPATAALGPSGLSEGADGLDVRPAPESVRAGGQWPLSFSEERFYRRYLAHGGLKDLGVSCLILSGPLDREVTRKAFEALVARHSVLRSRYVSRGDGLLRTVAPPGRFELPIEDLSAVPESARVERLYERLQRVVGEPWDLALDTPLVRGRLYRLDEQRHALFVLMHHITFDAESFRSTLAEIGELYRCLRTGATPEPAPPLEYMDYAVWQRTRYVGDEVARGRKWFAERVRGGVAAARALPADLSWEALDADRAAEPLVLTKLVMASGRVSAELMQVLERQCRGAQIDLPALTLAALGQVLAQMARQERLVLSTVMSARNRVRGAGQMLGNFLSAMPVVIDASGAPSLLELGGRVGRSLSEARQRSDFPVIPLVHESISDFERAQFNFLRLGDSARWQDLDVTPLIIPAQVLRPAVPGALLDLYVTVALDRDGAAVSVHLNERVWAQATAEKILAQMLFRLRQTADESRVS